MSLAKTMDDLERHIDYAARYFADIKSELEDLEGQYMNEIADLNGQISSLEEQNELLEEQVEELKHQNSFLHLEIMEVTMELAKLKA